MLQEVLHNVAYNSDDWMRIMGKAFDASWGSEEAMQDERTVEHIDRNTDGGRRMYVVRNGTFSLGLDYNHEHEVENFDPENPEYDHIDFRLVDDEGEVMGDVIEVEGEKRLHIECIGSNTRVYWPTGEDEYLLTVRIDKV